MPDSTVPILAQPFIAVPAEIRVWDGIAARWPGASHWRSQAQPQRPVKPNLRLRGEVAVVVRNYGKLEERRRKFIYGK
jgi:hypothetical protein